MKKGLLLLAMCLGVLALSACIGSGGAISRGGYLFTETTTQN